MNTSPPLHPDIAPLAGLLGEWSGSGRGEYPTIAPFEYVETVTFTHVGKPFLAYRQATRRLLPDGTTAEPLHAETGYWRCPSPDTVEVVVAHPTGIVEVQEGTLEFGDHVVVTLASSTVAGSVTAKRVDAIERTFRLRDDQIDYRVAMAAVGRPLQHHLSAELDRVRA